MRLPSHGVWLAICATLPLPAQAPSSASIDSSDRFIVTFRQGTHDLDDVRLAIAKRDQGLVDRAILALKTELRHERSPFVDDLETIGGHVVRSYWLIDGCAIQLPAAARAQLAAHPSVERIFVDEFRRSGSAAPIEVATDSNNHRTDQVHAVGVRGAGSTVAILDTGLDALLGITNRPHQTFFRDGNTANTGDGGLGGSRLLANIQVGALAAENTLNHGTKVAAVAVGGAWSTPQGDNGQAPHAKIVGYAIGDTPNGFALLSSMVQGWQNVVRDRVAYGIIGHSISDDGTSDPLYPEQQAMDSAVTVGDIFIAAMAGNDPRQQGRYQGAVNIMTAGAVESNSHVLASFSARGPLLADGSNRRYPQIVANGSGMVVPDIDVETVNTSANGTSYAAPNVAGAAALFRSQLPMATAQETRAALLATTADISSQNASNRAGIGYGYLRVDRLVDLATGAAANSMVTTARVDVSRPATQTISNVTAGRSYVAVIAWGRQSIRSTAWTNLDLSVSQSGIALGSSNGIKDTQERVEFVATTTGPATFVTTARSFEAGTATQDFAIAIFESGSVGGIAVYGSGCAGSSGTMTPFSAVPRGLTGFGNASSNRLLGGGSHRIQQLFSAPSAPGAFNANAIALRHDDTATPNSQRTWVEVEIDLGTTRLGPAQLGTNFDNNRGRIVNNVVQRRRVVLPTQTSPNNDPNNWSVVIPLDQVFHYSFDFGGNLFAEVRQYASSAGANTSYPLDSVTGSPALVSSVYANSATATTGTLTPGSGTAIGLIRNLGAPVVPRLVAAGSPRPAGAMTVALQTDQTRRQIALNFGLSNQQFGGLTLPLSLQSFGAPGCFLLASPDISVSLQTNAVGLASFNYRLPAQQALVGQHLYHQGLVLDLTANVLGVVTSNGADATIGN